MKTNKGSTLNIIDPYPPFSFPPLLPLPFFFPSLPPCPLPSTSTPHSVIRELGGKMYMEEKQWMKAYVASN